MNLEPKKCRSCQEWFVGRDVLCPDCRVELDEAEKLLPELEQRLTELTQALQQLNREGNQDN